MLIVFGSVAASVMSLPMLQPGTRQPSFRAEMNQGGVAAIQARLVISPAGVPIQCSASFVNGPSTNVDEFCSWLKSSARFSPGRDPLGRPAYGLIYLWGNWKNAKWIGFQVPQWDPPDLAVTTDRVPHGFAEGSLLRLALNTDASGKVTDCAGSARLAQQDLNVLCRAAAAQTITPLTDENGKPVAGVQEFIVRVTSQGALDKFVRRVKRM